MKVLVVGGSGYLGKRIVKASLLEGHQTYVVQRPEIGLDIEKLQLLLSFKRQGAVLVPASFSDFHSLVDAVKRVDVVISAMSGVHFRSHNLLLQLKLVEAIRVAGNIKVFFLTLCFSSDNLTNLDYLTQTINDWLGWAELDFFRYRLGWIFGK